MRTHTDICLSFLPIHFKFPRQYVTGSLKNTMQQTAFVICNKVLHASTNICIKPCMRSHQPALKDALTHAHKHAAAPVYIPAIILHIHFLVNMPHYPCVDVCKAHEHHTFNLHLQCIWSNAQSNTCKQTICYMCATKTNHLYW